MRKRPDRPTINKSETQNKLRHLLREDYLESERARAGKITWKKFQEDSQPRWDIIRVLKNNLNQ